MRLYLMRHAEAGDADARRWPDDSDRPLTDDGERAHAVVAGTLLRMGVTFDRLLTSPLVRARRTAEITAAIYGGAIAPEETAALDDNATLGGFLALLARLPRDAAVLAVGHEPFLSAAVGALVSRDGAARVVMPKSGMAAIEFDGTPAPGGGRLLFHLRPQEVLRLAETAPSSPSPRPR